MSNNYRMSYFMPPIAPIKDKQGRLMTPPTLIPFCEVSIEQVFQMITCNENLKTLTAKYGMPQIYEPPKHHCFRM